MQFPVNNKKIYTDFNFSAKNKNIDNPDSKSTDSESHNKTNKKKKAVFISTAAALAALGVYVATKGKFKNFLNQSKKAAANTSNKVQQQTAHAGSQNTQNVNTGKVNQTASATVNNSIQNVKKYADDFVSNFLKGRNPEIDKIILSLDFSRYAKGGIPLKYSRNQFLQDINDVIKNLDPKRQDEVLKQFNLQKGYGDIDGIPVLSGKIDNSAESQKIKQLIENFYYKNETTFPNTSVKNAFDEIIKGFPEFNMITGKVQHGTHIYSVDVHSLLVLQKSMKNPAYAALSDESKEVLKLTALLHDFGKKGKVITTGHAAISKNYAQSFIDNYNLSPEVKERVLNQVENHHWFESYNKGMLDAQGVKNIFKTQEDLEIAKILAKSDFESVNPDFHLFMMNPYKILTQSEFDAEFAAKMAQIGTH